MNEIKHVSRYVLEEYNNYADNQLGDVSFNDWVEWLDMNKKREEANRELYEPLLKKDPIPFDESLRGQLVSVFEEDDFWINPDVPNAILDVGFYTEGLLASPPPGYDIFLLEDGLKYVSLKALFPVKYEPGKSPADFQKLIAEHLPKPPKTETNPDKPTRTQVLHLANFFNSCQNPVEELKKYAQNDSLDYAEKNPNTAPNPAEEMQDTENQIEEEVLNYIQEKRPCQEPGENPENEAKKILGILKAFKGEWLNKYYRPKKSLPYNNEDFDRGYASLFARILGKNIGGWKPGASEKFFGELWRLFCEKEKRLKTGKLAEFTPGSLRTGLSVLKKKSKNNSEIEDFKEEIVKHAKKKGLSTFTADKIA